MVIDKIHYISQAPEKGSHLTAIEKVLRSGCKWIQLRVKEQSEADVLTLAFEAARLCREYKARLIINDYPRIALACGAYGVHLGLDDMPMSKARAILGKNKCIGGTANTFEDVLKRAEEGVDYIGLGPFRFTSTKKNLSPVLGIEGYTSILEQMNKAGISIPVIAIGGIGLPDIEPLFKLGIHGIAVSGLLTRENDLKEEFYVNYSR
jgi:thiamine-phosphate pyrophosphorylase